MRDGEELAVGIIPRSVSQEDRERGIGPVGFSYEPERLVEEPSTVTGPFDARRRGRLPLPGRSPCASPVAWPMRSVACSGSTRTPATRAGRSASPRRPAASSSRRSQQQLLFVGILSINLAVLNVLPFPPLDGGRIAVVLLESVGAGKLPAEREALIYLTGFAVLMALIILISIQDIQRLIAGLVREHETAHRDSSRWAL